MVTLVEIRKLPGEMYSAAAVDKIDFSYGARRDLSLKTGVARAS